MAHEQFEGTDTPSSDAALTDTERIKRLEAEVRRLSRVVADLSPLAQKVATMERKWAAKESSDRSLSARYGRR
ncbi:hypothetical protein [Nocardia sp. NBC_01009]|uniref:hypothetical protein n=1 Tax=Nocardia sp. NBC_01009 TaxID=2975996 RepID=UPI0038688862|nr:hypothetical protein OHA42_23410 [Nocardia sp. NBC_01009]